MYTVITHNGKAHIDEVMGIALLVNKMGCLPHEIIRIHPDEAVEWINRGQLGATTYYIDCGFRFEPENNIFDHHHEKDLESSAYLIFNHFYEELLGTKLSDYISILSKVDTKGPKSLDDFSSESETLAYFSFMHKLLVRQFETRPMEVIEIISNGISDIINFEIEKEIARQWLAKPDNIRILTISNLKVLEYLNEPPANISKAVKSADGEIIDREQIDVIYSFDREDKSVRTLFRTLVGHDRVDFNRSNTKQVKFSHHGGFLLKFIPVREDEWKDIILQSEL